MSYTEVKKGIVKRNEKRELALFIDGTGLDRATRRINRKVDMSALVKGVTSGLTPIVARYYTLIPFEDDSRQRAFLDAVSRAGMQVIVKRLPPKGISRQVSVDVEMSADIIAFSLGHSRFSNLSEYKSDSNSTESLSNKVAHGIETALPRAAGMFPAGSSQNRFRLKKNTQSEAVLEDTNAIEDLNPAESTIIESESLSAALRMEVKNEITQPVKSTHPTQRIITVVCPGRDLAYSIALAGELGVDTVNADFGQFMGSDVLKSAAKWIDLSDSETIWRD